MSENNSKPGDLFIDDEGSILPPLHIELPGFLKFMPPLVQEAARRGAVFNLDKSDWSLTLDGFYKNGPMKIIQTEKGLVAVDKHKKEKHLAVFDDLVLLNFEWWRASNSKTTYIMPERPWLDCFIDKKWVKRKVIFEPADSND